MTPEAAADAVRAFKPKVVYPYHHRGSGATALASAPAGSGIVRGFGAGITEGS
jgi:hypothetical protein